MTKKPYQRARYVNNYNASNPKSQKSKLKYNLLYKQVIATISSGLLVSTLVYDGWMRREVEININNPMTLVTRLSNPCASVERLEVVIDKLQKMGMDSGNTSLIPDTFFYASDSELRDLGVFVNQLQVTNQGFELQCKLISDIAPELKNSNGESEIQNEKSFVEAMKKYPKLGITLQTADYSTTSSELDRKLLDPTGNPTTPDDIHLMPYLRYIIGVRYLCCLLLFIIYFYDVLKVLQKMKLFKLIFMILDKAAPWKIK
jgi:hypothetical protein